MCSTTCWSASTGASGQTLCHPPCGSRAPARPSPKPKAHRRPSATSRRSSRHIWERRVPLLELAGLTAGYGHRHVLHEVDLNVEDGEIVAILGANGAGKTTTLRAISGVIQRVGKLMF